MTSPKSSFENVFNVFYRTASYTEWLFGRFYQSADLYFSLSQFVNEQNWFHLFSVSKKHSLSRLKSEIRRFVGANLTPVSDQISFKVNPFLRNTFLA